MNTAIHDRPSARGGRQPRLLLLRCLLGLLVLGLVGEARAATEYELKAAVMYRMLHFVRWPDSDAAEPGPIHICVYGDSPFQGYLEKITAQSVRNRSVEVSQTDERAELPPCEVIFVSESHISELAQLSDELAGHANLLVSDIEGFVCSGGMIGLQVRGKRIRFTVHQDRAAAAGLTVSAKLLELSEPANCGETS